LLQRYGLARNGICPFLDLPATWHAAKQQSAGHSLIPGYVKATIALCVVLCLLPVMAVGQSVTVVDFSFSPNSLSITAGQTVTWTWSAANGAGHDVISGASCNSDGSYSSPLHINSGTFTHQFTAVGTYSYFCSPHCISNNMTGTITVNPAAATHLVMTGVPGSATAGTPFNVTVTAYDQFGNVATGYGGTVSFSSSDGQAVLPSGTLFSGQRVFSITLKTAGSQSLTANGGGVSSSGPFFINVSPAATSTFLVSVPSPVNAGTAFSITVTAKDPYNNTTPGYGGTVHFTSSDLNATLPANNTLVSGVRTFSGVILRTTINQSITATDTLNGAITGFGSTVVNPGPTTNLGVSAPPSASVGLQFSITVTARDQFNNKTPSYAGTVQFSSSDGGAALPANSTLSNGLGIFGVTLNTVGTQSVTATDTVSNSIHGSANVTVKPPCPAAPKSFSNNTAINFSTTGHLGIATTAAYPSPLTVSGMTGTIGKLTLTLNGLSVTACPAAVAILLQGPHGQFIVPMSLVGQCNTGGGSGGISGVTVTMDDAAVSPLPQYALPLTSGTYRPASYLQGFFPVAFQAPAPAGPYTAAQLAASDGTATFGTVFNGTDANGTWNLYLLYQNSLFFAADSGSLAGWSLTITPQQSFPGGAITINDVSAATPYPSQVTASGLPGNVTNVSVTLNGFSHTFPHDVGMLLVSPGGQRKMVIMADTGGPNPGESNVTFTLDDIGATVVPSANFVAGIYKPTAVAPTDNFPLSGMNPPPSPPYPQPQPLGTATFASTFNGIDPNGTWSLYVMDDAGGDIGTIASWNLNIQTDCPAGTNCTVNSNANPSVFGQPVGLTATVASGSGTPFSPPQVTYLDGASNLATINLNGSGQSLVTDSIFTIGTHPITVSYPGNTTFAACSSATLNQVVNTANTASVVVSSASPSVFGVSVTFTATVAASAPGAGTPTGTVTFMDGISVLGSGTLSGGAATFSTASLAVGAHSITVVYGGDADFNGSTSPALTQTVNQGTTTTGVGTSGTPSIFGNSVTFTATVAVATGIGTPTGTVSFFDGANLLGSGLVSSGQATFSTASLAVGSHTIKATYNSDTDFSGSTSGPINQNVNKGTTTTSVVTSGTPSVFGNSVTFTATVAVTTGVGTPTGTVTFFDGATSLGSGVVNGSGHAPFSTALLGAGSHNITATYNGDASFSGSTSSAISQNVSQGTTTTVVGTSGTPSAYGSSVTFTATVAEVFGSGTPTGTVTFIDGVTTLGSGTLNGGGVATFLTTTLTLGSHSISAVYNGDANLTGSPSSSISQVVNQATTTTALASSPNPSLLGHSVTFTATVSPQSSGVPTGSVTLFDTTTRTIIGSGTLNGSGVATVLVSSLAVGSHDITATYSADTNFQASTSAVLTQVVNSLPVPTVTLTSHPNPAAFKQTVTLTATVSITGGPPTGTVTFKDGANTLGTVNLTPVNATTAVATMTTNQWTIGSHQLTALYNGDFNFGSGPSPVLVQLRTPKPH